MKPLNNKCSGVNILPSQWLDITAESSTILLSIAEVHLRMVGN